jgi:lipopolysaccharide export system permease protein
MTFVLAMIVLILQFVWKWIDELVGKGLSWSVIGELLLYTSTRLVPTALILGVLLASIMTFGNLGEHSELSALKSSGISLSRIMAPLFVLVILLTIGAFYFSNNVVPKTNKKFFALLVDIRQQRPEFDIKEGQFYNGIENYSLKIGKRAKNGKMLFDLMIYDHTARNGNVSVTVADSGFMVITEDKKNMMLTLYKGHRYAEVLDTNKRIDNNKTLRRDRFQMQQFLFRLPGNQLERTDEELYKDNYQMKTMAGLSVESYKIRKGMHEKQKRVADELIASQYFKLENKKAEKNPLTEEQQKAQSIRVDVLTLYDSLPQEKKADVAEYAVILAKTSKGLVSNNYETTKSDMRWVNRHMIEWHRKLTLSIACLVFFLIGAPLGSIIRKGGLGTPVVVSTLFFIFYYIISLAGEKYARAGILPVWLGMWGSTVLLLPLGIFLTIKSTRDSSIMISDTYSLLIRKILRFGRRIHIGRHEDSPANQ